VCVAALFVTLMDVTVTNVALPSIGNATHAAPAELQWVISGYALAFGVVPIVAGRLGDDHGRRLLFLVGIGGFVVTSAMAGSPAREITTFAAPRELSISAAWIATITGAWKSSVAHRAALAGAGATFLWHAPSASTAAIDDRA